MTEQAWYHMTKGDERARVKCNCKLCREQHYGRRYGVPIPDSAIREQLDPVEELPGMAHVNTTVEFVPPPP